MCSRFPLVAIEAHGFERVCVVPIAEVEARAAFFEQQLTQGEQEIVSTLSRPKRRTSFVAGRIAAKRALIGVEGFNGRPPNEIEILRDETGRPVVSMGADKTPPVALSISHGGDFAAAAAAVGRRVGVDVEPVAARALALSRRIGSREEREQIERQANDRAERELLLTRLFSAKEAMAKCLGTHLFHALHHYRLEGIEKNALSLRETDKSANRVHRVLSTVVDRHVFSLLESSG